MTYVYDNANRLIFSQSDVQRASGGYLQHYYDNYSFLGTAGFTAGSYVAGDEYGKGYLTMFLDRIVRFNF